MTDPGSPQDAADAAAPRQPFRWQALFEHTTDALFVLDRRLRLVFGNRAWESLAQAPADQMQGMACRHSRPPAAGASWEDVLAHALTPPPEAVEGQPARVRRLLPGRDTRQWWEIDFLPLRRAGKTGGWFLLGRIRVLGVESTPAAALPERLVNLRQRAIDRCTLDLWTASKLPAVPRLVEQVRLAITVQVPVLLVGATGAGKQSLARAIHCSSAAREKPFIALDCDRLPSAAAAGVLFVSGDRCSPGAIYLREPAALARDLQLRLAESLGPGKQVDAPRLLAGSRAPLQAELAAGRMTEELSSLLGTLVIEVPGVRQRMEELPELVEHVLERTMGEGPTALGADVWGPLRAYAWPGNLRELHRTLSSARRRAGGEPIKAAHLPAAVRQAFTLSGVAGRSPQAAPALDYLLEQAEKRLIQQALRRSGGHLTKAAQLLGIWRQRLVRRMEALRIADVEGDPPGARS